MICTKCGHDNTVTAVKDPWCMYRVENGLIINKLFDPDKIPGGWFDSPKAARKGAPKKLKKADTVGLMV